MENISKLTPILYEKNETNFNHNGLGKLTKLLVNEIDEVLNGEFEAFFEYPANGRLADKIDNEMFIKAKPNKKDDPHVFKVYDYDLDTFTQTYLIYARSKNIEDLKNNVILDVNVKSLAPTQAWNLAKNNALDPVVTTFYSDIATTSSVHWERRSLLSTIAGEEGSMIQYWGGEIKHGINRISLFRRRGQDNVTTVRHGKNLDGLKATYSTKGLVTAIVPYYVKSDDKAVYGDVVESQYINNYPSTYYDIIEYNDEELGLKREDEPENGWADSTIKSALNRVAKRYFNENVGKDLPSINMEIALEDISQTKEYEQFKNFEQIEIGDTITVYSKKFNVNINAKVRRVVYNGLTDKNELVEVGTARRSLYDDVRDDFKKVETELQEGIDHAMTSANGKNTNYYGTADPNEAGLVGQNNDNYFRTNGQLKELWIYRDGMWHLEVGDLTGQQIRAEVEQAQVDIEAAQATADEAVNRINGEIAGKFTDIDTEINQVHQDAQNALNQAGDAVSQVAYFGETLDGFTQTVANIDGRVANIRHDVDGITSTVSDQTGRIATVEQNVNGIQQTVSDPVNGLVTQVSTLANGFNVLATDFENMEIGGRNLLINSTFKGGRNGWATQAGDVEYVDDLMISSGSPAEIYRTNVLSGLDTATVSVWVKGSGRFQARAGGGARPGYTSFNHNVFKQVFSTFDDMGNGNLILMLDGDNIEVEKLKLEKGNKATDWTPAPEDMATQAQLSVLNDNINLRVEKGDVINQINISDENILLQANKIQALGDVVVDGKLTITDEFIAPNAQIDGAKIADATIGSAKIVNLDAGKITTGELRGVHVYAKTGEIGDWNLDSGVLYSQLRSGLNTTIKATGYVALSAGAPNPRDTAGAAFQLWHSGRLRWLNTSGDTAGDIEVVGNQAQLDMYSGTFNRINLPRSGFIGLASNGELSIQSSGSFYINPGANLYIVGDTRPSSNGNYHLGGANYRWSRVWTVDGVSESSDVRLKNNIVDIPSRLLNGIEQVEPKMYEMNGKIKFGYIAQDVERELFKYATQVVGSKNASEYMKQFDVLDKNDESYQALIYSQVEVLKGAYRDKKIEELEERIEELENAS